MGYFALAKAAFRLPSKGSRVQQELVVWYLYCLLLEFAALWGPALRNHVAQLKYHL